YSHSHAIAQCRKFLHNELRGIPYENVTSTAAAAKMVMENTDIHIAAIANEMAEEEYGLTMAKQNIHDYVNHHTKFIVLSKS
ncbi:UNVERIFIED_CONTAM: prephenate dehydratase, partial [Bacillus sp. ATCC 13368]